MKTMKINSIMLEITDRCNLNCSHCMNRPDSKKQETSLDKIDELFKRFSQHDVEKIYLTGGEPMLHKSIYDIVRLCKKYDTFSFVITTNGLLLTEELMRIIEDQGNVTLQFSVDGVSKETYEFLRGENTYERFISKLKIWDQSSLRQGLARTCVTKKNFREIPEIYRFCLEHRLFPSFTFVGQLGNSVQNWPKLELNVAQKIWCIDMINRLNDQYQLNVSTPEAPATCNFTLNAGIISLLIRADGRVAPCQYFYDDSLGNIYQDQIEDIFCSPWIEEHCKLAEIRKNKLLASPKCRSCKIRAGCGLGCMGLANNLGDIMGYDGLCDLRIKTTICYSNRLIEPNSNTQRSNAIRAIELEERIV